MHNACTMHAQCGADCFVRALDTRKSETLDMTRAIRNHLSPGRQLCPQAGEEHRPLSLSRPFLEGQQRHWQVHNCTCLLDSTTGQLPPQQRVLDKPPTTQERSRLGLSNTQLPWPHLSGAVHRMEAWGHCGAWLQILSYQSAICWLSSQASSLDKPVIVRVKSRNVQQCGKAWLPCGMQNGMPG
jgi:hypothetical protein